MNALAWWLVAAVVGLGMWALFFWVVLELVS